MTPEQEIKQLLEQSGKSAYRLGKDTDTDTGALSRYFSGKRDMTAKTYLKLKRYLKTMLLLFFTVTASAQPYIDVGIDPNKIFGIIDNPRTKIDNKGLDWDLEIGTVNIQGDIHEPLELT